MHTFKQSVSPLTLAIVADEKIAQLELLEQYGNLIASLSSAINTETVRAADVLIVRTETKVDQRLLAGSNVKFVGSATIGCDHVDLDYLAEQGIQFANAPGCNARAVVEYVISAIVSVYNFSELVNKRVGIIGCGNTGSGLYRQLKLFGINCYCYDPPLKNNAKIDSSHINYSDWANFDDILQCDIISLHTPLTLDGEYPTHHLIDEKQLNALPADCLLINTSRGSVINNNALLGQLQKRPTLQAVLDVWENEPDINLELLQKVTLGTPHIAGYSQLGKNQATSMLIDKLRNYWGIEESSKDDLKAVKNVIDVSSLSTEDAILKHFNPTIESDKLKANYRKGSDFKTQRNEYEFRLETSEVQWSNIHSGNQLLKIAYRFNSKSNFEKFVTL